LVEINSEWYRPGEVSYLRGSYQKIKDTIGWVPTIMWEDLLKEMLAYDMILADREAQEKKSDIL
jgi:GDPmannose 4,6-dehydratase